MTHDYGNEPIALPSASEPEAAYTNSATDTQIHAHHLSSAEIERILALEHAVVSEEEIKDFLTLEEFDQQLTDFIHSKFESRR